MWRKRWDTTGRGDAFTKKVCLARWRKRRLLTRVVVVPPAQLMLIRALISLLVLFYSHLFITCTVPFGSATLPSGAVVMKCQESMQFNNF